MAAPGPRGQFDKASHPYAYPNSGGFLAFARKSSAFEKVCDAITTTVTSDPYAVNACRRFTVKVYSTVSISCDVQVCADSNIGDWFTVATLNNSAPVYSSEALFTSVRLNVTGVVGVGYGWLLRDYNNK